MPRYLVTPGTVLAMSGVVVEAGSFIELPRAVADDSVNRASLQEVDEAGHPVTPLPVDDLERFRSHERVSILLERLATAQAAVKTITQQLAQEERRLLELVQATAAQTATAVAPHAADENIADLRDRVQAATVDTPTRRAGDARAHTGTDAPLSAKE
jgi:hypothetical protein